MDVTPINCVHISMEIERETETIIGNVDYEDMEWKFKDKAGHTHKWRKRGESYDIPTTEKEMVEEEDYCYECGAYTGDTYERSALLCRKCGEEIIPGYKTVREEKTITTGQRAAGHIQFPKWTDISLNSSEPFKIGDFCKELTGEGWLTSYDPSTGIAEFVLTKWNQKEKLSEKENKKRKK